MTAWTADGQIPVLQNPARGSEDAFFSPLAVALVAVGMVLSVFWHLNLVATFRYSDLVFLGAGGVFVLQAYLSGRSIWCPVWFIVASGLLLVPPLLQMLPYGFGPAGNLGSTATLWFCLVLVPVLLGNIAADPRAFRTLCLVWIAAAVIAAFSAMVDSGELSLSGLRHGKARLRGIIGHPNVLGAICALPIPVLMAGLLSSRSLLVRGMLAGLLPALLYVINRTGSRRALAAALLAVALVLFYWVLRANRRDWAVRALAFVMGVATGVGAILMFLQSDNSAVGRLFGKSGSAAYSDMIRSERHAEAWEDFWQRPFVGRGYKEFVNAHNYWLSMLRCGGVFAFLALVVRDVGIVVLVATAFRSIWIRRRRSEDLLFLSMVIVYLCTLLFAWSSSILGERYPPLGVGLLVALSRLRLRQQPVLAAV